jgi:hypothetical protein
VTEFHRKVVPLLVVVAFTLGHAARGQDLFEGQTVNPKDAPAAEEKETTTGDKESIF